MFHTTFRALAARRALPASFAAAALFWWAASLAAAAGPGAPVLAGPIADQSVTEVAVLDHAFEPSDVTIGVGSVVRWTNRGQTAHTVTSDAGLFHAVLQPGQAYNLQFLSRGTFGYHCLYHRSTMTGRVVVGDQQPPTPPPPVTPGPAPEPGAQAIVFDYFADGTSATRTDLFVIEPDGSNRQALTSTPLVSEAQPSWSPNRGRVAFTSTQGDPGLGPWMLSVLELATGQTRRITAGPEDYEPAWHPDGSLIVYTSLTRSGRVVVSSQLAVVAPDGTSPPRPLLRVNSTYYSVGNPNWSPDGKQIAFVLESGPAGGELYVYDWGTRVAGKLYDHPGWNDIDPTWSPDGRFVAFASGAVPQPYVTGAPVVHDIWVLDTATGVAGAVVHIPEWDLRGPSWSPDGTELVFSARYQTGPSAWGLYVAPAFGGVAARPLTPGVEPDWGRSVALPPTPGPMPTATLPLPPEPPTLEPPSTIVPPPVTPGPSPSPPAPPTFAWPTGEPPEPTPTEAPPTEPPTEPPTQPPAVPTASPTPGPPVGPAATLFLPIAHRGTGSQ